MPSCYPRGLLQLAHKKTIGSLWAFPSFLNGIPPHPNYKLFLKFRNLMCKTMYCIPTCEDLIAKQMANMMLMPITHWGKEVLDSILPNRWLAPAKLTVLTICSAGVQSSDLGRDHETLKVGCGPEWLLYPKAAYWELCNHSSFFKLQQLWESQSF